MAQKRKTKAVKKSAASGAGGRTPAAQKKAAAKPKSRTGAPRKVSALNVDYLRELTDLMSTNHLTELEIEQDGVHIRLRKGYDELCRHAPMLPAPSGHAAPAPHPMAEAIVEPAQSAGASDENTVAIKSPMVGTFYSSPAPDAEPFLHVGDAITEESVVCIIEAMKVMNEIKADIAGEITEILVESGEMVEYGQPLMRVRKDGA